MSNEKDILSFLIKPKHTNGFENISSLAIWPQIFFCNRRTICKESVTIIVVVIIIIISIVGVLTKISPSLLNFQVHFLKAHHKFLGL